MDFFIIRIEITNNFSNFNKTSNFCAFESHHYCYHNINNFVRIGSLAKIEVLVANDSERKEKNGRIPSKVKLNSHLKKK